MKKHTSISVALIFSGFLVLISACGRGRTICGADSVIQLPRSSFLESITQPGDTDQFSEPVMVEINGKMKQVDMHIEGPLCNNHLKGRVYIACGLQIPEWEEISNFLEACDFTVEPDSVIYVGSHNDTPFYKGCSCHTGEE